MRWLFLGEENSLQSLFPELCEEWSPTNEKSPSELTPGSEFNAEWVCGKCGEKFNGLVCERTRGRNNCPKCLPANRSAGEIQLEEFISSVVPAGVEVEHSVRNVIPPKELDIFIPELLLAFEYNGDYWHSDEVLIRTKGVSSKEYHELKTRMCKAVGIELIHIYEHEWLLENNMVKRLIVSKIQTSAK